MPASPPTTASMASAAPEVAALAERFRERLRVFAARRLGDAAEAEDVAQETLRRVIDALQAGRVRDPAALPAFVFRTATHVCQHHQRFRGRQRRALERYQEDEGEVRSRGADALGRLISEERRAAVRHALERLSAADRGLLRAFFYEGLGTAEVAHRHGATVAAIRVRKHRALQRLERTLRNGGETFGANREPGL